MRTLARVSPFTWCIDSIRDIMVYGRGLEEVQLKVLGSFIAIGAALLIAWYILKHTLRRYIE
jgi:hypothetical protein